MERAELKIPITARSVVFGDGKTLEEKGAGTMSSVWAGKNVGFLGDSITDYGEYVNAYKLLSGCNAVNYGVSGTTIAISSAGSFLTRLSSMANDLDMVVVLGGVNDHRLPVPLGVFDNFNENGSLNNTFYGALHTLMRNLRVKYKGKPIVFLTPMHNSYRDASYGDTGDYNWYEFNTNKKLVENKFPLRDKTYIDDSLAVGSVLSNYVKAIKEVAAFYSVNVIDLYSISGIQPILDWNSTEYTRDGIHPNEKGGMMIAKAIYPYLEMLG